MRGIRTAINVVVVVRWSFCCCIGAGGRPTATGILAVVPVGSPGGFGGVGGGGGGAVGVGVGVGAPCGGDTGFPLRWAREHRSEQDRSALFVLAVTTMISNYCRSFDGWICLRPKDGVTRWRCWWRSRATAAAATVAAGDEVLLGQAKD